MLRSTSVIALCHEALDPVALTRTAPSDGAVALFIGVVRGENRGRTVTHLEYEAYEEMAMEEMARIEAELRAAWPVTDVRMVHRLGHVEVGEASVIVAVTSPHRKEAFAACRQAIDTLKARVPIWKKEHYGDGTLWLDASPPILDRGGHPMKKLEDDEVARHLADLAGWERQGESIRKKYLFPDFRQALAFVNKIGALAEEANHHPDIELGWGRVVVSLSTHDAGGITARDLGLARSIDS